jgi:hypothetical protein
VEAAYPPLSLSPPPLCEGGTSPRSTPLRCTENYLPLSLEQVHFCSLVSTTTFVGALNLVPFLSTTECWILTINKASWYVPLSPLNYKSGAEHTKNTRVLKPLVRRDEEFSQDQNSVSVARRLAHRMKFSWGCAWDWCPARFRTISRYREVEVRTRLWVSVPTAEYPRPTGVPKTRVDKIKKYFQK